MQLAPLIALIGRPDGGEWEVRLYAPTLGAWLDPQRCLANPVIEPKQGGF